MIYGRQLTDRPQFNDVQMKAYRSRYPDLCCAAPDCPVVNVEPDLYLVKCEACNKGFCQEMKHVRRIGDLWFCDACACCSYVVPEVAHEDYSDNGPNPAMIERDVQPEHICGDDAACCCGECGRMVCAEHANGELCRDCAKQKPRTTAKQRDIVTEAA